MTVRRRSQYTTGPASDRAVNIAASQGLALPPRPERDVPRLPREMVSLADVVLMELFNDLTGWSDYLDLQLSLAQVDEEHARSDVARHEALNKYDFRKVDAKEQAFGDQGYLALKHELEEAYGYRKVIEALYNRVDRNASAVSRELTRRLGRHDKEKRRERWSSRGSG
jgi:hypothetical protein